METYYEALPGLCKQSAIALGFFDGVHPGHQVVIGKAKEEALRLGVPCGGVTFKDHPRTLTKGRSPLLLTVIEQRLQLFEKMGVDFALVLTFSEELCRLSLRRTQSPFRQRRRGRYEPPSQIGQEKQLQRSCG